jgi:hypothetical protein
LSRFLKRQKVFQPHAFFFQAPEKPLDHAVLFRRIRRNEFLRQAVIPAEIPESFTLKHKSVIASDYGFVLLAPGGSKPVDTGIFQSPFSFIGTSSESELKTDTASVMTVDQSYQVPQPSLPQGMWVMSIAHLELLSVAMLLRPFTRGLGVFSLW